MTNNRTDFPDEIAAAAARWAERFAQGMSEPERAEFKVWLGADPQHSKALAHANLNQVDCDWAWQAGVADVVLTRLDERARRRLRARRQALAGAGAAVLLGVSGWIWQAQHSASSIPTGQTGSFLVVASPRKEVLPDGSVVELRGDARIASDFSGKERAISLLHGTAYFEVAKDPNRPFVVRMGRVAVRAVGTAFTLELMANHDLSVLVTEGRVGVYALPAADLPATLPLQDAIVSLDAGKAVSLQTGEQLNDIPVVRPVNDAELTSRTAWRMPRLEFSSTPLCEVVALMNQHNARTIILGDNNVGQIRVSGILSADKLDALAAMLETEFHVKVERRPEKIVLRSRG
jgi:transmembrane sensor